MDALAPFATAARAYAAAAPTWALALVAVGAVLSLLNAWLWLKKAPYRRIPGPPSYFLIGHVPYLVTEPWKQFYRFALQYGSVYKMWVWDKLFVVVTDPDLVKHVFLTKRHIYPKDAWSYKFFMCVSRASPRRWWAEGVGRYRRSPPRPVSNSPTLPLRAPQGHPGPRRRDVGRPRVEGQAAAAEPGVPLHGAGAAAGDVLRPGRVAPDVSGACVAT